MIFYVRRFLYIFIISIIVFPHQAECQSNTSTNPLEDYLNKHEDSLKRALSQADKEENEKQYVVSHFSIKPDKAFLFFVGQIFSCNIRSERWTHEALNYFTTDIKRKVIGFINYENKLHANDIQNESPSLKALDEQTDKKTISDSVSLGINAFRAGKNMVSNNLDCDDILRMEASKIDSIIGYLP